MKLCVSNKYILIYYTSLLDKTPKILTTDQELMVVARLSSFLIQTMI